MTSRRTAPRSITADGLARLLARLHADTDEAAARYEWLRRTLIRFFDWRGAWPPDECADETLDRLTRRLEEDTRVQDIQSYAYGIARLVLLERRRRPSPTALDEHAEIASAAPVTAAEDEALRACFDRCLAQLPNDQRALLLEYYEGERQAKIANRHRLAAAHGMSDNALRSRVQRLRERLEQCVRACVASGLDEEPR